SLQETERAADRVPAGQLALDVHRAPVQLFGDGVDLEAVLQCGESTVGVARLHASLGKVGDRVESAPAKVFTRSLDPLPRVAAEQLAAVFGDGALERVGGGHAIAHAGSGGGEGLLEAPHVDTETFDL